MKTIFPAGPDATDEKLANFRWERLKVLMRSKRRLIFALLFVLAAVVLSQVYQGGFVSNDQLREHEQSVRRFIVDRPLVSFCIGFMVYTIVSLIPGTPGKSILFGWLFGLWSGLAIVCVSLTIAATIGFLLSRYLFRELARRKFAFIVRRLDQAFARQGPIYLVLLRLLHVPYSPLNYMLGATSIATRTFAWTTFVGMIPGNFAFVLAGSQLPTLSSVLEDGIWSVIDFRVLAALSVAVLIPLAARKVAIQLGPSKSSRCEQGNEVSPLHSVDSPDDCSKTRMSRS